MRLEAWSTYIPPPGSVYRVHYVPDNHSVQPDLAILGRALDARPAVALRGIERESSNGAVAEVAIYIGDASLVSVLGTFVSDGGEHFWRVDWVERVDSGVPSGLGITVGRILDATLDPLQTAGVAAKAAASETVQAVRRVGVPTAAIFALVVAGFFLARMR